jgi:hypothetical protein
VNDTLQRFGRTCASVLALTLGSAGCTDDGSDGAQSGSSSSTSDSDTSGSTTTSPTGVEPTTGSGTTGSESASATESSSSGSAETGSSSSGSGGSDSTGSQGGAFEEARTYESYWTTSKEHCAQQMKQGSNCSYLVSFCPDGRSAAVWSDIVGAGSYTLDGTSIEAQWRDVRFGSVSFEYDPESDTLQDSVFSQTWDRSFEFSLLTCD